MSMLTNIITTIQSIINTAHQLIICLISINIYIYVKRFIPLTSNTAALCSVLYRILTSTAIWSGNFLVFYNNLALAIGQSCFVLFCVYNTIKTTKVLFTDPVSTTAELDLLIRILSPLTKILLCSTCYSYNILQLNTLLQGY